MALTLTINGVTKTLREGSLSISKTANGRATASFDVVSTDGSYRPAIDTEVVISEDAAIIFAGVVQRPEERGLQDGYGAAGIVTKISCVDFNSYAERRAVNGVWPAGTLKSKLIIMEAYLTWSGTALDPGQVDGPTLPEQTFEWVNATDVLNELMTLTAAAGEPYVWKIDENNLLSAYQPTTTAAPFNITTNTPAQVIGDITVKSSREHYANNIIVLVASRTELGRTESFTGDGSTTAFPLNYQIDRNFGYVTSDGVYETLSDTGGGGTWEYDAVTNTITRTTAPANTAPISITFDGTLATFGLASDAGEIASVGYVDKVIRIQSVPSAAAAQERADAELAAALAVHNTVSYQTLEAGLEPGMTQTINVPRRNVNVTGVISDVNIRDFGKDRLVKSITVLVDGSQTNLSKNWRDTYKKWSSDTSGGGAATTVVSPPSGTTTPGGPGGPNTAVQFNRAGAFGGVVGFTFDEAGYNLVMGDGGSSITAAVANSCVVFGYDCHITDP